MQGLPFGGLGRNDTGRSHIMLSGGRNWRKQVFSAGFAMLIFTRSGNAESFFRAAVVFEFWHCITSRFKWLFLTYCLRQEPTRPARNTAPKEPENLFVVLRHKRHGHTVPLRLQTAVHIAQGFQALGGIIQQLHA